MCLRTCVHLKMCNYNAGVAPPALHTHGARQHASAADVRLSLSAVMPT